MAQNITLHGGPWHGRTLAIEDGHDHFHIIEPFPTPKAERAENDGEFFPKNLKTREGTYSRVGTTGYDFEWDGWTSHD